MISGLFYWVANLVDDVAELAKRGSLLHAGIAFELEEAREEGHTHVAVGHDGGRVASAPSLAGLLVLLKKCADRGETNGYGVYRVADVGAARKTEILLGLAAEAVLAGGDFLHKVGHLAAALFDPVGDDAVDVGASSDPFVDRPPSDPFFPIIGGGPGSGVVHRRSDGLGCGAQSGEGDDGGEDVVEKIVDNAVLGRLGVTFPPSPQRDPIMDWCNEHADELRAITDSYAAVSAPEGVVAKAMTMRELRKLLEEKGVDRTKILILTKWDLLGSGQSSASS